MHPPLRCPGVPAHSRRSLLPALPTRVVTSVFMGTPMMFIRCSTIFDIGNTSAVTCNWRCGPRNSRAPLTLSMGLWGSHDTKELHVNPHVPRADECPTGEAQLQMFRGTLGELGFES